METSIVTITIVLLVIIVIYFVYSSGSTSSSFGIKTARFAEGLWGGGDQGYLDSQTYAMNVRQKQMSGTTGVLNSAIQSASGDAQTTLQDEQTLYTQNLGMTVGSVNMSAPGQDINRLQASAILNSIQDREGGYTPVNPQDNISYQTVYTDNPGYYAQTQCTCVGPDGTLAQSNTPNSTCLCPNGGANLTLGTGDTAGPIISNTVAPPTPSWGQYGYQYGGTNTQVMASSNNAQDVDYMSSLTVASNIGAPSSSRSTTAATSIGSSSFQPNDSAITGNAIVNRRSMFGLMGKGVAGRRKSNFVPSPDTKNFGREGSSPGSSSEISNTGGNPLARNFKRASGKIDTDRVLNASTGAATNMAHSSYMSQAANLFPTGGNLPEIITIKPGVSTAGWAGHQNYTFSEAGHQIDDRITVNMPYQSAGGVVGGNNDNSLYKPAIDINKILTRPSQQMIAA
jgi:hypothetical protein